MEPEKINQLPDFWTSKYNGEIKMELSLVHVMCENFFISLPYISKYLKKDMACNNQK